ALLPVARRPVEERLREAVFVEARPDLAGGMLVGKEELDALEPVLRRRGEAIEEGVLVVQHREVRGEARHRLSYQRAPNVRRRSSISSSRSGEVSPRPMHHSFAVSSSSSSTAMAAAGESFQTFGPRRSSITARIG